MQLHNRTTGIIKSRTLQLEETEISQAVMGETLECLKWEFKISTENMRSTSYGSRK